MKTPAMPAKTALDVLLDILTTQTLKGSGYEGKISGSKRAVCFQNTPLYSLGQMFFQEREIRKRKDENAKAVADVLSQMKTSGFVTPAGQAYTDALIRNGENPEQHKYRYELYGLSFMMPYVWSAGGRPVVYEESDYARKELLDPDQHWRIVDTDFSKAEEITDWTHEREWRIPTDAFNFDINQTYILLPDTPSYHQFMSHPLQKHYNIADHVAGIVTMMALFY